MPIPISKIKYGSYPSKNTPYVIHVLSLHVYYRISGGTLRTNKRSGATNRWRATNKNEFNA